MKRKGFTLIELLAVIVILAVIALITTTIITKVVENARKNAAKNSALNYLDSVEKYVMYHDVDDIKYPYDLKDNIWNIVDNTTKEISLLNIITSVKAETIEVPPLNDFIKVNGSKPTSGTITIDSKGKITNAIMIINKYNIECTSSSNCSVEGKDTDSIPILTIDETKIKVSETKITIPYTVEIEKGNATVECVYGTDENYGQTGVINEENNTCTLSNLSMGTTYYFKLTPKSDKNKQGKSQTASKTTLNYILSSEFKIGDYIKMIPSYEGEYTPITDSSSPYYTGTASPGSVTPRELDTWVVIRKNDDGTIEMVSLNVSSSKITLYGLTGYNNIVEALNKIAEQYENSKFTISSRHVGYPNRSIDCNPQMTNCDVGATIGDLDLIEVAIPNNKLISTTLNGDETSYFIASRLYLCCGAVNDKWWLAMTVDSTGKVGNENQYLYATWNSGSWSKESSNSIRPILTLKPDVVADPTGDGSSEHPWVLIEP